MLRNGAHIAANKYWQPILGIIFLRYADILFKQHKKEIEEERRLSYVAFTRAQNALFLSDSEGYNFDNTFRSPSRFIFNIDKNVLKYETEIDVNLVKMTQDVEKMEFDEAISADIFDVNDRVFHKVFGNGTIIKVDLENQEYTIKFDNISTMRTLSSDAGMKKL